MLYDLVHAKAWKPGSLVIQILSYLGGPTCVIITIHTSFNIPRQHFYIHYIPRFHQHTLVSYIVQLMESLLKLYIHIPFKTNDNKTKLKLN